jgi:hypothetical protein
VKGNSGSSAAVPAAYACPECTLPGDVARVELVSRRAESDAVSTLAVVREADAERHREYESLRTMISGIERVLHQVILELREIHDAVESMR